MLLGTICEGEWIPNPNSPIQLTKAYAVMKGTVLKLGDDAFCFPSTFAPRMGAKFGHQGTIEMRKAGFVDFGKNHKRLKHPKRIYEVHFHPTEESKGKP